MTMKRILFFLALAALCAVSCKDSGEEVIQPVDVFEFKASLPQIKGYDMFWQDGDVVSAGTNNSSTPLANVPPTSRTASFHFSKALSNGAVVRFPESPNPNGITVPAVQTSADGKCKADAMPLYGTVSLNGDSEPSVDLKCLMAILKFSVKGEASLVKARLESLAGAPLNGVFSLSKTGAMTNKSKLEGYTEVTFSQPLVLGTTAPTDIYMTVPPAVYEKGFTLKLYDGEDNYMMVKFGENGCNLAAQSITEIRLNYAGGNLLITEPGGDFGDGTVTDLDQGPIFGEYSAQGKVMYDDGQPAVGVKVSDGFTVVQTDDKGKYAFKANGLDVRYIYISMPADAVITKNADTCPDFYHKYEVSRYIYDFTLKRQPVENEFAFFAFADPQTHYQKRDTQTMPDTDRFGNESMPAINAEIAKQTLPCYGVCLGDITYSEGSRDSTPSMKIIRGHIGRINMPVFNAMGNHDYTYYKTDATVSTQTSSSTINLLSQRSFEDVFGPINFSFDRGKVHFVCMKDIYYNSTSKWDAGDYTGGFTDAEYNWLVQDLEMTPKDMKVVLCVHIPISTSSGKNIANVKSLLKKFTDSIVFSGHTHYQRTVYEGGRLYEQIHSAVCGQWWWSKIEGDGCPNGYTIHYFNGTDIKDSYFIGVNDQMNTRDYQMRIYKGNLLSGGKYAKFQSPYSANEYLINVFNGDEKWKVKVYENGVYAGQASLLPAAKSNVTAGSSGTVHNLAAGTSQDWWAIGYHIGYCKRGTSGTSYQTANYHMWKWIAKDPSAKISVEATDPYGNTYTCDEVVTDGQAYPEYIKIRLSIF